MRETTGLESVQIVQPDVYIFGLPFWSPTYEQFCVWWNCALGDDSRRGLILGFANAHTFNQAYENSEFRSALESIDVMVNDGIGFRLASGLRGVQTPYNLNGTDLVPRLLRELTEIRTVFLYGASEESNRGAAEELSKYPNVKVVGRISGFVDPEKEALPAIVAARPDILLVALGHPRQELFCVKYRQQFGARICIPVGGLFDFLSQTKARAPQWMRSTGIEWVYRFWLEPRRMFRRYVIGNPLFLIRSLRLARKDQERLRSIKTPNLHDAPPA